MKTFSLLGLIALTTMSLNVLAVGPGADCLIENESYGWRLKSGQCSTDGSGIYTSCNNGAAAFQETAGGCRGEPPVVDIRTINGVKKPMTKKVLPKGPSAK